MLLQCLSGDTPEDVTPWSVGRPALNQYIIFLNFLFFFWKKLKKWIDSECLQCWSEDTPEDVTPWSVGRPALEPVHSFSQLFIYFILFLKNKLTLAGCLSAGAGGTHQRVRYQASSLQACPEPVNNLSELWNFNFQIFFKI